MRWYDVYDDQTCLRLSTGWGSWGPPPHAAIICQRAMADRVKCLSVPVHSIHFTSAGFTNTWANGWSELFHSFQLGIENNRESGKLVLSTDRVKVPIRSYHTLGHLAYVLFRTELRTLSVLIRLLQVHKAISISLYILHTMVKDNISTGHIYCRVISIISLLYRYLVKHRETRDPAISEHNWHPSWLGP